MRPNKDTKGACLWFTGLSGSGKSTIADLIANALIGGGFLVERLDGDDVRKYLTKDLGFSRKDRDTNIERVSYVAQLLTRNDVFTLVSFISPYRVARDKARALIDPDGKGLFIEIYVEADIKDCIRRDVKGLYQKAIAGEIKEFTGISDPYEEPLKPELHINTSKMSISMSVETVMRYLKEKGFLKGFSTTIDC